MHVSVTVLGAHAGSAGRAAGQIVDYLHGGAEQGQPEKRRSGAGSVPTASPADGIGGYFADSTEAPGRWRGEGTMPEHFDLGETVEAEAFRRVLLGQDPRTEETLLPATGSSANSHTKIQAPSDEPTTTPSTSSIARR